MRRALTAASAFLLLTLLVVAWRVSSSPKPIVLVPTLTGQPEYCLTCHSNLAEISPSHPVQVFGCVRCHGGERLALDAGLAHSTMRGGPNPSDLSVAEASCGGSGCHSDTTAENLDQIQRITTNVHATYAGAIAAVRYSAGAQPDPAAHLAIAAVSITAGMSTSGLQALAAFDPASETSAPLKSFSKDCLNCHLSAKPPEGIAYARFTGCSACHTRPVDGDLSKPVHKLSVNIAYSQCNTCHNRGTYDVRTVHFQARSDQPTNRQTDYYPPGTPAAKCEYLLECVDCHTPREVMGDGGSHGSQTDSRYVQCKTCHGTTAEPPLMHTIERPDDPALKLASLNLAIRLQVGDTIIVTSQGEPLWNTRRAPDGRFELTDQATGQHFVIPPVKGSGCTQQASRQDAQDCHACHSK